ncbi:hypothetical protein [Croceicoccus marinus]|uniref:Uncharacterized protein n=1 Tax=Croceicoccus marinus TaxID=450378 RepID=A0A7G6VRC1_9SPHN|nr:hypothetical protein [Croceicoccus marinus]QNE04286.1 hypothetical protein H4O24_09815 [Croceicoccus marinus]
MAIVVKRGMSIGAMSAEEDLKFLSKCFVDTGQAEQISDISNSKCIALCRTGSGKSALLMHVEETEENFAQIDPEDLSLRYISNSDILRFFEEIDVNLDVFYQLLWRHVLVVELLKLKKEFYDADSARRWLTTIMDSFNKNPKRKAAVEYLTHFNGQFWLDTEKRIREVVDRIEGSLESSVGMKATALRAKVEASAKATSKAER